MEKTRVLIVEDDVITAKSIEAMIIDHGMDVIGTFKTGEEALRFDDQSIADIVIMDIRLQGKLTGVETAKALQEIRSTPIIYLSEYTDKATVRKAKDTHPANFLSKPFTEADLIRSIEIAIENANDLKAKQDNDEEFIFVKTDALEFFKLHYNEIVYIEADRIHCKIQTTHSLYQQSITLGTFYSNLNQSRFVKIHRSYVINIRKVSGIKGNEITVGGYKLPVSDQHRAELIKRLNVIR